MKAVDVLISLGIDRCPECNCPIGDDWQYVDFSNRTLTQCPQCGEIINLDN